MLALSKLITYFDKNTLGITFWAIFCFFLYTVKDKWLFIIETAIIFVCLNWCFNTAIKQSRYRHNKKLQQRKA